MQQASSPLLRHPLSALADQVLQELLGVEPQHPSGVSQRVPAIAGDVGVRHRHLLGQA